MLCSAVFQVQSWTGVAPAKYVEVSMAHWDWSLIYCILSMSNYSLTVEGNEAGIKKYFVTNVSSAKCKKGRISDLNNPV